jgi:hypothetical protein
VLNFAPTHSGAFIVKARVFRKKQFVGYRTNIEPVIGQLVDLVSTSNGEYRQS